MEKLSLKERIKIYKQITDWDYRWEFSGNGSINSEVRIKGFGKRDDGYYEVDYWHIKYGNGTILLDGNFEASGNLVDVSTYNTNYSPGLLQ